MTVTSPIAQNVYVGSGSVGPFPFTFKIFDPSHLFVFTTDLSNNKVTLNYLTDFTIASGSVDAAAGGSISLTNALTTGWTLTIQRVIPLTQLTNLRDQGSFFPATYEDALDYLMMGVQQLAQNVTTLAAGGGITYAASASLKTVKNYGAVGNGIHDDTAAQLACIADVVAGKLDKVRYPAGSYLTSSQVTFPLGVDVEMDAGAKIIYSGSGVCWQFDTWVGGSAKGLWIERQSLQWHDGTDSTSVLLRVRNCIWSRLEIRRIQFGYVGLQMYGDNASVGTADIAVYLGGLDSSKINLQAFATGGGFANNISVYAGGIHHEGTDLVGGVPVVGSRDIDLGTTGDGWSFFGVDLEGNAVEKNVYIGATVANCCFFGCRWESVKKVHFDSGTAGNIIDGGYANPGFFDGTVFVDSSGLNSIRGGIAGGIQARGYGATHASSQYTPALSARNVNGGPVIDIQDASGNLATFFDTVGKLWGYLIGVLTHESNMWDFRVGSWYTGDATQAATQALGIASQTRLDWFKEMRLRSGSVLTWDTVTLTANSTTPSVAASNRWSTANTNPTSITNLLGGLNQHFLLLTAADTNTTLVHQAGGTGQLTLLAAENLVMLQGQTIAFQNIGGAWQEIGHYPIKAAIVLATGAGHTVDDVITALQTQKIVKQS